MVVGETATTFFCAFFGGSKLLRRLVRDGERDQESLGRDYEQAVQGVVMNDKKLLWGVRAVGMNYEDFVKPERKIIRRTINLVPGSVEDFEVLARNNVNLSLFVRDQVAKLAKKLKADGK